MFFDVLWEPVLGSVLQEPPPLESPGFFQALGELILGSSGQVPSKFEGSHLLVFTAGSAMMGLLVVFLDWLLFAAGRRAPLDLPYGESLWKTIRQMIVWGLGAGVGAFLGSAADIFQYSRGACIVAGVGWPLILPRLLESTEEDQQRPVEDQQILEDQNGQNP